MDDTGETDVAAFPEEDICQFLELMPFRLPSESEWEYACRADSDTLFWWGDQIPTDARWAEDLDDLGEMDQYSNRFGLANFGAYPECCADEPHESYDGAPADGSSWRDDPDSQNFVIRGGAMLSYPWQGCGEWLQMLSADRFPAESDLGVTIRPAFTFGTI